MKIKLVTFAPHPNFGTCLQGYALSYVLRKMGHDVEFIYNRREVPSQTIKGYIGVIGKWILRKFLTEQQINYVKGKVKPKGKNQMANPVPYVLTLPNHPILKMFSKMPGYQWFVKKWYYGNLQKRKVYKFTFCDGNFKMRRLYTMSDYDKVVCDADMFITGSDQIWNPFCGGFNPMMFLEFVNDGTKCIAYSSSISQVEIHPSVKERMKTDLQKFTHIAVREQRSVELLNSLLGRQDVKLVVDPTYLLAADEWESFGNKAQLEFELPEKYIFCYFVGDSRVDVYERMVQEVKKFTGIDKVIALECYNRKLTYGDGMTYQDAGPYEWVYLLMHASYICMDSFHATVFSLKFQKEFVHAMKNSDTESGSQNTRMYDILSRYGILYKNYNDDGGIEWQKQIDYSRVTPIIEEEINDSLDFLKYEVEKK